MFLGSVAPPSSACISCPVLTSVSAMSCGSRWSRIVWQPWPPSSPNHTSLLWTDALQPSYRWCRPVRITTKTSFTTTWKDIIKTTINSLTKGGKNNKLYICLIYLSKSFCHMVCTSKRFMIVSGSELVKREPKTDNFAYLPATFKTLNYIYLSIYNTSLLFPFANIPTNWC